VILEGSWLDWSEKLAQGDGETLRQGEKKRERGRDVKIAAELRRLIVIVWPAYIWLPWIGWPSGCV